MRQFALGRLGYTPDRFGSMLVADFLDVMAGYNECERERVREIASLIRMSTTILLNVQLAPEDKITPHKLWPFAWDEETKTEKEGISDEEKLRWQEAQDDFLNNKSSKIPRGGDAGGARKE